MTKIAEKLQVKSKYRDLIKFSECSESQLDIRGLSFQERKEYFTPQSVSPLCEFRCFEGCPDELDALPLSARQKVEAICLVSALRVMSNYNRASGRDKFYNLSKDFLRSRIFTNGERYADVIRPLIEAGIIERDNHFIKGVKSFGYRLTSRVHAKEWKKDDFCNFCQLNVKGCDSPNSRSGITYMNSWNRFLTCIKTWRTMKEGELKEVCRAMEEAGQDLTVAEGDHSELIGEEAAKTHEKYINECAWKKKEVRWTEGQIIECYEDSLIAIDKGYFSVSCHDDRSPNFTNRVFSNVTNLKKEFRSILRLDGEKLYNIDIKSSQPALLASFYLDESAAEISEKEEYLSIIASEDKDIYLELAEDPADRKKAKTDMYTVMFGKVKKQRGKFFDNFKAKFPILLARINEKKEDDYKAVARAMQLKESSIMIEKVAYELMVKNKIKCFTVHDSILCREKDIETVKNCIFSYFLSEMSFLPILRVES